MWDFLFDVLAWLCAVGAIFWLLDRIENAWLTIAGQRDRESQLLDRYASSVYLASDARIPGVHS